MRQEMAEDDFKECAEGGKHLALDRDVLDRIEQHYARVIEAGGEYVASKTIVPNPQPGGITWSAVGDYMDWSDCCPQAVEICQPQRDGYFCAEHGITFIASCAMCWADVERLRKEDD